MKTITEAKKRLRRAQRKADAKKIDKAKRQLRRAKRKA
jgi:hypothetical protein